VTSNKIILVGGGTRSGKSTFALALARRLGEHRLFLATARPGDAEMRARIERHRQTRGDDFETIEEPLAVADTIARLSDRDVVVVDCLTLWLANLLLEEKSEEEILAKIEELAAILESRATQAVLVTNEVGLGIVPETALGRVFRDLAGLAHQRFSRLADEVYFGALGIMLRIKPAVAFVNAEDLSRWTC
jgi:adenosylcobinamide kinase/adenosylcobinamide-phosphate guanylyltransferase